MNYTWEKAHSVNFVEFFLFYELFFYERNKEISSFIQFISWESSLCEIDNEIIFYFIS